MFLRSGRMEGKSSVWSSCPDDCWGARADSCQQGSIHFHSWESCATSGRRWYLRWALENGQNFERQIFSGVECIFLWWRESKSQVPSRELLIIVTIDVSFHVVRRVFSWHQGASGFLFVCFVLHNVANDGGCCSAWRVCSVIRLILALPCRLWGACQSSLLLPGSWTDDRMAQGRVLYPARCSGILLIEDEVEKSISLGAQLFFSLWWCGDAWAVPSAQIKPFRQGNERNEPRASAEFPETAFP